ncbi:MAG: selenide, water dikinase SelD [Rickettsiales bacterium]|nr:selenide, water dikinase SelD [Rickettsiales bacterium]|tara:strand:- start:2427 stop:3467 length:1041 start_codon:yes stop_codon:yes gene_type:complete
MNKTIKLTEFSKGGGCGCKIPPNILENLIKALPIKLSNKLLINNSKSDDAAVYRISKKKAIAATTDFFMPIVDDPFDFGMIAATNALSDIYAMGAKPLFALAIMAMPINKLQIKLIKKIMEGGYATCKKANIMVAGGHTIESSEPIYGLAVVGEVKIKNLKTNSNAQGREDIILTKPLGTGILSAALKKNKIDRILYKELIENCIKLNDIGIELGKKKYISSITDVTGFGLLGHLKEVCMASNVSATIILKNLPKLKGVTKLINNSIYTAASTKNWKSYKNFVKNNNQLKKNERILLTDPQTSGGLLISCKNNKSKKVIELLKKNGYKSPKIIGFFSKSSPMICLK